MLTKGTNLFSSQIINLLSQSLNCISNTQPSLPFSLPSPPPQPPLPSSLPSPPPQPHLPSSHRLGQPQQARAYASGGRAALQRGLRLLGQLSRLRGALGPPAAAEGARLRPTHDPQTRAQRGRHSRQGEKELFAVKLN